MSTHLTDAAKRFRLSGALVALALAIAVLVLTTQAKSIWSTRNEPQVQPRQEIVVPTTNVDKVDSGHICRPKYGCEKDPGTAEKP